MSAPADKAASLPDIPVDTRHESRRLLALALGFLLAALLWAALAELNAGAIAPGEVIPAGRVRTVQHLEGGIIRQIAVAEGDAVAANQLLLKLDDTEARAALAIAETELAAQEALVARLTAERDGKPFVAPAGSAEVPSVAAQARLFESRRQMLARELSGLQARVADARREYASWEARSKPLKELQANAEEESRLNQRLYEQNFISRPRLLQLKSQHADMAARLSENGAEMARAQQRITETEMAIAKLKNDWANTVLEDLRRASDAAAAAAERVKVGRDRLLRTAVTAPQAGMVNGLRHTTVGGVISPGGTILDIVPEAEALVVEARIGADDIDVVSPGLEARVRLTAYKARSHVSLKGTVTQVSGSTFREDGGRGLPFYRARIEIGADELKKVERSLLVPGMLAEVEIVSGKRSALRYLFDPVLESTNRAFKEN